MQFEWDEVKNRANIRNHSLDFVDAWEIFEGPLLARLDTRKEYGEDRWIGVGMVRGRVAVVVFTERPLDTIRIISMRKANRYERQQYEKAIEDQLETH